MANRNLQSRMHWALVFAASLGLASLAYAGSGPAYCPRPDVLQKDGIPDDFEFYDSHDLTEDDYASVTGLDTVRLDQESAKIIKDQYATANYALCLYDTDVAGPFYMIRTRSHHNQTQVLVDLTRRVDPDHNGWGGFCWGPGDPQIGCIVVCHFHAENCPFLFSENEHQ